MKTIRGITIFFFTIISMHKSDIIITSDAINNKIPTSPSVDISTQLYDFQPELLQPERAVLLSIFQFFSVNESFPAFFICIIHKEYAVALGLSFYFHHIEFLFNKQRFAIKEFLIRLNSGVLFNIKID